MPITVVDIQITCSRIAQRLKRKMREPNSNAREQTKEP